ncbi:hypothetical protein INQ55_11335 [Lysinibacillus sphaericus]|nr:hypothetical protein INQ55_11335 [Lysinibacillus sphaericus]
MNSFYKQKKITLNGVASKNQKNLKDNKDTKFQVYISYSHLYPARQYF